MKLQFLSDTHQPAVRQHGFTMIEALVALVILAIGLLGIAALNLDALRSGRTAIYRTQAVNLAADMADRIRANRRARNSYQLAFGDTAPTLDGTNVSCETTTGCVAGDMALRDLARWAANVGQLLPAGRGQVNVVALGATIDDPSTYELTIAWEEPGAPPDDPATPEIESPFFTMRLDI